MPSIDRHDDGRFRFKATWKEEVLEMLLKDQARRSVSDAEYTEILDDDTKSWGDDHGRAVAVWAAQLEVNPQ